MTVKQRIQKIYDEADHYESKTALLSDVVEETQVFILALQAKLKAVNKLYDGDLKTHYQRTDDLYEWLWTEVFES